MWKRTTIIILIALFTLGCTFDGPVFTIKIGLVAALSIITIAIPHWIVCFISLAVVIGLRDAWEGFNPIAIVKLILNGFEFEEDDEEEYCDIQFDRDNGPVFINLKENQDV